MLRFIVLVFLFVLPLVVASRFVSVVLPFTLTASAIFPTLTPVLATILPIMVLVLSGVLPASLFIVFWILWGIYFVVIEEDTLAIAFGTIPGPALSAEINTPGAKYVTLL